MHWDTWGGKNVMDVINAEIISDPDYELMKRGKVAIGTIEEAFPDQLPGANAVTKWGTKKAGSIPARLGRQVVAAPFTAFKASENAFEGAAYYMRYQLARKYFNVARKSGVDLTSKREVESIGKLVNALTARGDVGKNQPGLVNAVIWSPKMLVAHIDTLTIFARDVNRPVEERMSRFARKQAAIALAETIGGIAGILGIAALLAPGSAEPDPRSADFGKIKVKNTRFDMTGGAGSLVVLAWRLLLRSSKSSATGKVTPLNSGKWGSKTDFDVIVDFLKNKLSPAAGEVVQHLEGEDRNAPRVRGKPRKPTVLGSLKNMYTPFPAKTAAELLADPDAAPFILSMIADELGISTQTYPSKKPYSANK
jgi:hypothetical protein